MPASMLEFLTARRSANALVAPGPTRAQIDQMVLATGSVPDHGRMRPFRLAVIEGDGRAAFGRALAEAAAERKPGLSAEGAAAIAAKAQRSPTIIVLIASPRPGKIEIWEQHATVACAGYAIVLAAHALGVGAVWKSVPFTRGKGLAALFKLTETEDMFGWIHLGTTPPEERAGVRPEVDTATIAMLIDRDPG
ncbi:MAG: nitroreductase family protein [Kofleriaceae bacterium]